MAHFWQDRPTFVTGGTGLAGSWLIKALISAGANVTCLIRDWIPQSELLRSGALNQIRVVRGDICDQHLLERVLGEYEIVTAFHLAAQTTVPVANRNPVSTLQTNVAGTWTMLEACRRSPKVEQVVLASSDKAYGSQARLPCEESAPLMGRGPYDVSKSAADLIAQSYAETYQVPVAITRCGNFYGGGDLNWNRIVPGTIRSVLRSQRPIVRSDGKFVRDYFHVEDGARAYMMLAQKLGEDPTLVGQAFNFSNEEAITVLDLVRRILTLMGSELVPEILNQASHEIREQRVSSAKARRVLGWKPIFDLDRGLTHTIAWYRAFFGQTKGDGRIGEVGPTQD